MFCAYAADVLTKISVDAAKQRIALCIGVDIIIVFPRVVIEELLYRSKPIDL
jgi:hypothetical protein